MEGSPYGVAGFRLLRLWEIIGDAEKGVPPLLPISRATWLRGVKDGSFPKPKRLSANTVAWLAKDVYELIESLPESDVSDA